MTLKVSVLPPSCTQVLSPVCTTRRPSLVSSLSCTLIASGCTFVDSDHGTDPDRPMNEQPMKGAPIVLEENVWIGAQCMVLKGVRLGKGAVIGAGSVVTKSVPAGEVWAGVPARRLKQQPSEKAVSASCTRTPDILPAVVL